MKAGSASRRMLAMRDQIVFGDSFVDVELPDDVIEVSSGVTIPLKGIDDLDSAVQAAIDHPIDLPPLSQMVKPGAKVLIAFDDATVPCYVPLWSVALKRVIAALYEGGVDKKDITLICANSLHRQLPHDELAQLIGADLAQEFGSQMRCHDAEDPDGIQWLGITKNGYHVALNKAVIESDLTIYLNCSTTRGFSGGWKSICVGLSSYRSIAHHHTPDLMSMSLDRNAMHAMLDEMGAHTIDKLGENRFFKIETVMANPLQVGAIFGGSVDACRKAALDLNRAHMTNRRDLIDEKADVVLYGVPDWSPYAAFSHTNPLLTLVSTGLGYLGGMIEALGKPGCTVILATPCENKWDMVHHPSYKEVWDRVLPETKDPEEARRLYEHEFATREDYIDKYRHEFGFHGVHGIMALYPLKRLRHASRVIVAGATDSSVVSHVGFTPASSVEGGIAEAKAEHGADARIAFVRYPQAINR